jgi:hypothetical protein
MDLLFVTTDAGCSVLNPGNKQELLKFNVSAGAACIVGDEIVLADCKKPLLFCYKLHRSLQAPRKMVMPGKVVSLSSCPIGPFIFGGIGGNLKNIDLCSYLKKRNMPKPAIFLKALNFTLIHHVLKRPGTYYLTIFVRTFEYVVYTIFIFDFLEQMMPDNLSV